MANFTSASIKTAEILTDLEFTLRGLAFIMENYIVRVISGIGILLNILSLIVIIDKRFKHSNYSHLWCRTFCNLIVCIFGVFYLNFNSMASEQSYEYLFVSLYVINIPMRTSFLASAFSEITLILNRLLVIKKKKKTFFASIPKVANLTFCYMLPICGSMPAYMSIEIK